MTRLPVPGSDDNTWGSILNDFLSVEHDSTGALLLRSDGTLDNLMHTTGTETVAGVKTFSSSPVVPVPTLAAQAANKQYVDAAVSAVGGGGGSGSAMVVTVATSNYAMSAGDWVILANASAGWFTITLPAAASADHTYAIKKTDATSNAVLVVPSGGELIDSGSSATLALQNMSITVVSDGSNWYII
jgi:hypothetical protein